MAKSLSDYKSVMEEQLKTVETTVAPFTKGVPCVKGILKHMQMLSKEKLAQQKPQVMFFGLYNAGKSSILNEILGEDKAKVADVPTTDRVDIYSWRGYEIADTPGVGAPIEHEEVTMEHLKKADVVIFVMSTTGSIEKKENYDRMLDIVKAGKKVIVVLNDKDGYLGIDDDAINVIRKKVYENIRQIGIIENCQIVVVNAKRARRGRVEGREGFIKSSNIAELEQVIHNELKKTSSYQVIRNTISEVEQDLEKIIAELAEGQEAGEREKLKKVLQVVHERKKDTRENLKNYIKNRTERMGKELPDKLWETQGNVEEAQRVLSDAYQEVGGKVAQERINQINEMLESIEVELKTYITTSENGGAVSTDPLHYVTNLRDKVEGIVEAILEARTEQQGNNANPGEWQNKIKDFFQTEPGKKIIQTIFDRAIKFFEDLEKKKPKNNSAKVSPTVMLLRPMPIPPIPIDPSTIVKVLKFIWDMICGDDDEEELKEQAKQGNAQAEAELERRMKARNILQEKCGYMAEDFCEELINESNEILNAFAQQIVNELTKEINSNNSEEDKRIKACEKLKDVLDNYNNLKNELEGLYTK